MTSKQSQSVLIIPHFKVAAEEFHEGCTSGLHK